MEETQILQLFRFDDLFLTQGLPDIAYMLCNGNFVGDDDDDGDADDEFERVGLHVPLGLASAT